MYHEELLVMCYILHRTKEPFNTSTNHTKWGLNSSKSDINKVISGIVGGRLPSSKCSGSIFFLEKPENETGLEVTTEHSEKLLGAGHTWPFCESAPSLQEVLLSDTEIRRIRWGATFSRLAISNPFLPSWEGRIAADAGCHTSVQSAILLCPWTLSSRFYSYLQLTSLVWNGLKEQSFQPL